MERICCSNKFIKFIKMLIINLKYEGIDTTLLFPGFWNVSYAKQFASDNRVSLFTNKLYIFIPFKLVLPGN